MLKLILIILAIILVIILLFALIWHLRTRRFKPTRNKLIQQNQLNADLEPTGFAYDLKGDYFYSLMDCWQREMGYCKLYDEGAPLFNMIMDCEPITFSYGGKRWLIELWKGQYGITTGAEIGIYNTTHEDIDTEKFKGTFYETIQDNERMPLSFVLRKNGKVLLRREELHWWLTGFVLGEYSSTDSLTMDAKIQFPNREMCSAFVDGLRDIGYQKKEYSISRKTVTVHYTIPHNPQPLARNKVQEAVIQQTNENNCKLYKFATGKYSDTLDKIEYLKTAMPELYQLFLKSLYARGLYEAFEWIIDIIHGKKPVPPKPPIPPEPPCPPKPPCPPEPCPCPPEPCPCPPEPCPAPPESCPAPPEPCPCPPEPCPCSPEPCPCSPEPPRPLRPCPCPPRPCSSESSCGTRSCPTTPYNPYPYTQANPYENPSLSYPSRRSCGCNTRYSRNSQYNCVNHNPCDSSNTMYEPPQSNYVNDTSYNNPPNTSNYYEETQNISRQTDKFPTEELLEENYTYQDSIYKENTSNQSNNMDSFKFKD